MANLSRRRYQCDLTHNHMNHCASIASKFICSEHEYIVYGHTAGLVGSADEFEETKRIWETELAKSRERGKESDSLLFHWTGDHWAMCGSLYDFSDHDREFRMAPL